MKSVDQIPLTWWNVCYCAVITRWKSIKSFLRNELVSLHNFDALAIIIWYPATAPQHCAALFLLIFSPMHVQGLQGLSAHFEMALKGRKKVAMSNLMVAPNSQRRYIFKHMVRLYVPIKPCPQWPHILQKLLRKRVDIGHSIPMSSIPVLCEVAEARV